MILVASGTAEEFVAFPWGNGNGAGATLLPTQQLPQYRTLARPGGSAATSERVILNQLPEKATYAYGWFGSNPTPIWGRHFGHSKNFTQWTQR